MASAFAGLRSILLSYVDLYPLQESNLQHLPFEGSASA